MPYRGAFGGGGDGRTGSGNTCVLTYPTGAQAPQPGDVAVVITSANLGGPTASMPDGWQLLRSDVAEANNKAYLFAKVLTAADIAAGSLTVQWTSSGRVIASGVIHSGVTGVEQVTYGDPFNADIPTVDTAEAGAEVIALSASRTASGGATLATYPASYTKRTDSRTAFGSGVNTSNSIATLNATGPAGTYGGGIVQYSVPVSSSHTYAVALTPVPVAPTKMTPEPVATSVTGSRPDFSAPVLEVPTLEPADAATGVTASRPELIAPVLEVPTLEPADAATGVTASRPDFSAPVLEVPTLQPSDAATSVTASRPEFVAPSLGVPRMRPRAVMTTVAASRPELTAPTLGVPTLEPADVATSVTTSLPKFSAPTLDVPVLEPGPVTIGVTASRSDFFAPSLGVPTLKPRSVQTTVTTSRPRFTLPGAVRRDLVVTAGPLTRDWTAAAPLRGWSGGKSTRSRTAGALTR